MREAQLADADISNLLASFEHATGIHFAGSSRDLPAALIQHVVTSRSPRLTSLHIDSEYGDAPMSLFAAVLSTRMPTLRDLRLIARTLPKKPLETITAGAPFPGLESLQLKTYKESIPLSDIWKLVTHPVAGRHLRQLKVHARWAWDDYGERERREKMIERCTKRGVWFDYGAPEY
jgi:hypothetical protein